MTNLTENEMAAIAAGLWDGERCMMPGCAKCAAPDMRDPANLWRALEKRKMSVHRFEDRWYVYAQDMVEAPDALAEGRDSLTELMFAALVALYKAEHPQE